MDMLPTKTKYRNRMQSVSTLGFILMFAVMMLLISMQLLPPKVGVNLLGFKTFLIADTKSMEPDLLHNDMVVVIKFDYDALQEGDSITFMGQIVQNNAIRVAPITHKIVEVILDPETGERFYRTQGTNAETNPRADTRLVSKDGSNGTNAYIGKYAFKMRLLGQIVAYFQSPFGIVALVVYLAIILTSYWWLTNPSKRNPMPKLLHGY